MSRPVAQRAKHAVKVAIAYALYGVGLLQVWQRYLTRGRAVVLMYHRVLTGDEWRTTGSHPAMAVTTKTFERQMAQVRRRFVPLTLDQFADRMLRRQPFADGSCLITFDDGWRDTMTNALPVLRRANLPAVVFLPVNLMGSRRPFAREAFAHLLMLSRERVRHDRDRLPQFRTLLAGAGLDGLLDRLLDLPDADAREAAIESVGAAPLDASIETLVARLSEALGIRVEQLETPDTFMTWPEVEGLARDGVTFGGHGANHRQLALLQPAAVEEEVRVSKQLLETRARPAVWAFSYPNGSCNDGVARIVRESGYDIAFTTRSGVVSCQDEPLFVKRINIHEDMTASAPMFLARIVGLF